MINPEIVLPGIVSGLMWAVAQSCWFIANGQLSMQVAFPLVTSGPGFVAAIWGVFVLGEIKGRRNYAVLLVAGAITITSDVCIALSTQ